VKEIIEIEDLNFSYPDNQEALKAVNLTVCEGETVALIGPNGAGKSTLILHLNGILRSDGRVKVLGQPITDSNLREIRSKVGLVFQNPDDQLFSPTVFDDVAFGLISLGYPEDKIRQSVARALDWVGMTGYEKRSPHHLSLGERKRVAIATVLSMDAEILVIDEPTSSLDPRGKWALIDLLKRLPVAKIIASHDLELVQALCQRTVILDRGRIIADDKTERVLADMELLGEHGLACPQLSKTA